MSWTAAEQRIYNHLRSTLPRFLFQKWNPGAAATGEEVWSAIVKGINLAHLEADFWILNARIKQATGIFLSQHARDRGTYRQANETDAALRQRLIQIEDVVTKIALKAGVDAILGAFATGTTCTIVELRGGNARLFLGIYTSTGRAKGYVSRGFRITSSDAAAGFIVILPYPTPTTVRDAVNEYVTRAKAAGIYHRIEVRLSP